jgi:hypothetical protein
MSKKEKDILRGAREAIGDLIGDAVKLGSEKGKAKRRTGTALDPERGKATRYKKGHNRPGPGRPKKVKATEPMREALRRRLMMKLPVAFQEALKLPRGVTWAEAIAITGMYDMLKNPDVDKFKGYAEESDGKQAQEVSGPGGAAIPLDLSPTGGTEHEQLRTVAARLRDRLLAE